MYFLEPVDHFGNPEPKSSYRSAIYDPKKMCGFCGRDSEQVHSFCISEEFPEELDFVQTNWIFDEFFCRKSVASKMLAKGITGFATQEVFVKKGIKQVVMREFVQLKVTGFISIGSENTAQLKVLKCPVMKVPNEDILQVPCNGEKFEFKAPYTLSVASVEPNSDFLKSQEWFGTGGLAFRQVLASERFRNLYLEMGWKGLELNATKSKNAKI